MVNYGNGEETRPVEINIGVQVFPVIDIEQAGTALGDIGISQVLTYDRAIITFDQSVVIRPPRPGSGETN